MAMNKKEQQMVEELKTKLALRFTDIVKQDIPIPESFSDVVKGYNFNSYLIRVHESCSSSVFHGNNHKTVSSQRPISQFSKKSLAARAMRNELELEYAKKLRRVDLMIEQFEKEESENKI